jgi:kynurenine formamidase
LLIDLSHIIFDGLQTYKGLDTPVICDFWSRSDSEKFYEDGSAFHIGKIEMVANTGTYIDAPFHRFEKGKDLSELELKKIANLPGILIDCTKIPTREIPATVLHGLDVKDKAILFFTGWSDNWNSEAYFGNHPFLSAEAAILLKEKEACLVGIDSYNIDDSKSKNRPVHTTLLGAGIPIVEHLTHLNGIPKNKPFRFSAVPPKIEGLGSFPVRAFAETLETNE